MIWRILRIIRIPNLFIIALIEIILHQHVLHSLFLKSNIESELNSWQFSMLVIYSLLLTLSGYVINDIFDVKIDKVNKPQQNWVMLIGLKSSKGLYAFLTLSSLVISVILALQLDKLEYIWITPVMSILLWAYSRYFKSMPLLGNIWVSIFCTLVILLIWLSEERSLHILDRVPNSFYQQARWLSIFFGLFAFFVSLSREIVKDTQDIEGDLAFSANTYPIRYGILRTKRLLCFLFFVLILLTINILLLFGDSFSLIQIAYIIFLICIPLSLCIYLVYKAQSSFQFGQISTLIKCIMIAGTLLLLTFPI